MVMEEGLDTGPMLLKASLDIGPEEGAEALAQRLSALTASLLVQTLAQLGSLTPQAQDPGLATLAPPLNREDAVIDWRRPAQALHDQVRGLQGWPGTQALFRGEVFKLRRTRVAQGEGLPGQVIEAKDRLLIACGQGALEVLEGQLPNRKPLVARDLINGVRVRVGEILE